MSDPLSNIDDEAPVDGPLVDPEFEEERQPRMDQRTPDEALDQPHEPSKHAGEELDADEWVDNLES